MKYELARVTVFVDVNDMSEVKLSVDIKAKYPTKELGMESVIMAAAAAFVREFSKGREFDTAENSLGTSPEMEEVIAELRKTNWPVEPDGSTVVTAEEGK